MQVPVIIPTRDEQGAPARTIVTLWNAMRILDMEPVHMHVSHFGYAYVRTAAFRATRKLFGRDIVRGFMLDDDMLLPHNWENLIEVVKVADKNHWNIVAPYMLKNGLTSLAREDGTMLSIDDVNKMDPWSTIPLAGLGFYYGDIPLDYEFHEADPYKGEDFNFFHDKKIELHVAPLEIKHLKMLAL